MRILAIGGGENGRPGKPYEIKKFDEEIIKMTGKKNPNFYLLHLHKNLQRVQKIITI